LLFVVICGAPSLSLHTKFPRLHREIIVVYNEPALILQANFGASDQEQWWWEGERVARSFIDCGAPLLSNRSGEVVEAALTTEISLRPSEAMS